MEPLDRVIGKYGFTMISKRTKWSEEKVGDSQCPIAQATRLLWDDKPDDALHVLSNGESDEFYFIEGWIYQMKLKNYEKAAEMYQKCSPDYQPALYNIGVMYQNGAHFEKNIETARQLWTRGAEAGYGNAILGVGILDYKENRPGWKDLVKRAREIGIAHAYYILVATETEQAREAGITPSVEMVSRWIKDLEPVLGMSDEIDKTHASYTEYLFELDRHKMCDILDDSTGLRCGVVKGEVIASIEGLPAYRSLELQQIFTRHPKLGDLFMALVSAAARKQGMNIESTKMTKCVIHPRGFPDPFESVLSESVLSESVLSESVLSESVLSDVPPEKIEDSPSVPTEESKEDSTKDPANGVTH